MCSRDLQGASLCGLGRRVVKLGFVLDGAGDCQGCAALKGSQVITMCMLEIASFSFSRAERLLRRSRSSGGFDPGSLTWTPFCSREKFAVLPGY